MEMPACNAATFQVYLDEMSNHRPDEFKIIVLDNGAFHKARALQIPENIALIFLPPYSPELNPAEKMWAKYKRQFSNRLHHTLDELSAFIEEVCTNTCASQVKKTCAFEYVFSSINWTI